MSVNTSTQTQEQNQEASKASDKELNFRKQEAMYQKMLEDERKEKLELQRQLQERSKQVSDDDDITEEPYVDHRRLERKLSKFEQKLEQKIDQKAEQKARLFVEEEKRQQWLRSNPDFYDVVQHAQKLQDKDPELADTILAMPEGFERQKLVYRNIKALGLHKKEEPKPSIQETIDKNRRTPYYQPSGMGAPPYGMVSGGKDYSPSETKNAYDKMKELQARLRI